MHQIMFRGKHVTLGSYDGISTKEICAILNDFEIRKNMHPGVPFPFTETEEQEWLAQNISMRSDARYTFAVRKNEGSGQLGHYIGGCGINKLDWKNSVATLGIMLQRNYLGKGYGTEAMQLLLRFVFEEMNINKAALQVFSFNQRAIRSYEKCGFVQEGCLRSAIFRMGAYHDDICMGLLRSEWQATHGLGSSEGN